MCLKLAQSGINAAQRSLDFFVDRKDVENLVAYIMGYAKLFGNQNIHYFEQKPSSSAAGNYTNTVFLTYHFSSGTTLSRLTFCLSGRLELSVKCRPKS